MSFELQINVYNYVIMKAKIKGQSPSSQEIEEPDNDSLK